MNETKKCLRKSCQRPTMNTVPLGGVVICLVDQRYGRCSWWKDNSCWDNGDWDNWHLRCNNCRLNCDDWNCGSCSWNNRGRGIGRWSWNPRPEVALTRNPTARARGKLNGGKLSWSSWRGCRRGSCGRLVQAVGLVAEICVGLKHLEELRRSLPLTVKKIV
jgi:hypothetical protein